MLTFVVTAAPEWAETINNTQIDIGSEHTMRCVAMGKPFPFIRWYKDGYMVRSLTPGALIPVEIDIYFGFLCFPVWERRAEVFQSDLCRLWNVPVCR